MHGTSKIINSISHRMSCWWTEEETLWDRNAFSTQRWLVAFLSGKRFSLMERTHHLSSESRYWNFFEELGTYISILVAIMNVLGSRSDHPYLACICSHVRAEFEYMISLQLKLAWEVLAVQMLFLAQAVFLCKSTPWSAFLAHVKTILSFKIYYETT